MKYIYNLSKQIDAEGNQYYGQLNAKGEKHGYGCCFLADGSYYEGEWKEDDKSSQGGYISHNNY